MVLYFSHAVAPFEPVASFHTNTLVPFELFVPCFFQSPWPLSERYACLFLKNPKKNFSKRFKAFARKTKKQTGRKGPGRLRTRGARRSKGMRADQKKQQTARKAVESDWSILRERSSRSKGTRAPENKRSNPLERD